MKALKISIEYAENKELCYITFKNITVYKAMAEMKKLYPNAVIYSVRTEY